MPSNQSPLGALPARFRRPRLLLIGCGDVGLRVARALHDRVRPIALTSSPERAPLLRRQGILPLAGDLDQPATLRRLAGLATHVLHLAPPATQPPDALLDRRTRSLLQALRFRTLPTALVYGSTSGVYGDCGGERVSETRLPRPASRRAMRRLDAEELALFFGRATGTRTSVLRIPGIYAPDRDGGTPRMRLQKGTPVLSNEDDVFTNHIHADDLAQACVSAVWRGRPQRRYNVNDDTALKMGDYFDVAADLYGLPRPPRISRLEAGRQLPQAMLSFMDESRRMDNTRMKRELKMNLRYPTVHTGLRAS